MSGWPLLHELESSRMRLSKKLRTQIFLTAIIALLFSPRVHAQSEKKIAELRVHGERLLDRLISQGHPKIGKLDLLQSRAQMAKIKWSVQTDEKFPASARNRQSAFFEPFQVTAAKELMITKEGELEVLAVHEALGALGLQDSDYQLSLNLRFLSVTEDPGLQASFRALIAHNSRITEDQEMFARSGGSGTSVGGGGDLRAIFFKQKVLLKLLAESPTSTDFLFYFSYTPFEPAIDPGSTIATYDYKFPHSTFVYLPAKLPALNDEVGIDALVSEIADVIKSLHSKNGDTKSKVYADCLTFNVELPLEFTAAAVKVRERKLNTFQGNAFLLGCPPSSMWQW